MASDPKEQKSGCLAILALLSLPTVLALGYHMGFTHSIIGQWFTIIVAIAVCATIFKQAAL